MRITADEMQRLREEDLKDLNWVKGKLRKATRDDFQIVEGCSEYPYAASFYGCYDLAHFKRKADCQKFINAFPADVTSDVREKDGQ